MFKFDVISNENGETKSFYNSSHKLGVKDTYRFLSWMSLTEFDLSLDEIRRLLKGEVVKQYELKITKCEFVSDLLI